MLRGRQVNTLKWAILVWLLTPANAVAGSAGRAIQESTKKTNAPTKEDGIDYFANERKTVTPEAAKQADDLRLKTIQQIKAIVENNKGKNDFELQIRLAELYLERSDYIRDQEINRYVADYDTWQKSEAKPKGKQPVVSYHQSETQLQNAITTLRKIVNKYPKHPRADAALYALASTLSRLNDENAVMYYNQLIKTHPNSPLIPDTWLALGEFYFDKHQIPEATNAYQQVMNFKAHRTYPYAIYKLGWCYYNSQGTGDKPNDENLRKSVAAFKLVVKLSDKSKDKNYNLRDEALRDLVMAFAETEDTEAAWNYFQAIKEEGRFFNMLERLGGLYVDAGKNQKAVEVYTRLVKESPLRKGNPQIYQKLLEVYDTMNQFASVVNTVKTMIALYGGAKSEWISAHQGDTKIVEDAKNLAEKSAHRYGTLFHSRGQKIKNQELEAHGATIYEMYLAAFPSTPAAYEIRYFLADIQLAQKKFEAASENFLMVAKSKPKDGKYLKEAALSGVTAMALLNESVKSPALPPQGQVPKPIQLLRARDLYIKAIDTYTQLLPMQKEGIAMRFTAAQILFDFGHYDNAVKRYDDLATQFSKTEQGRAGAKIVMTFFDLRSDWQQVITYGKSYQKNQDLMADVKLKQVINDCLRKAIFTKALANESEKEYLEAAKGFLEFQRIFPADPNADRALYNAALNFTRAGQIDESITQYKALLKEYPRSALGADVTASLGETYEALAQFQNAANTYVRLATAYPKDPRAVRAYYNAAVLYRGIKSDDLAAKTFAKIYEKYPDDALANEAAFESARLLEKQGDANGAIKQYESYVSKTKDKNDDKSLLAQAKIIDLQSKASPKTDARREINRLLTAFKSKNVAAPEARKVIARLLFEKQEANQKSFLSMAVDKGDEVEGQIMKKQSKLEKLAAAYEEVISVGDAEFAVASLYQLGLCHKNFAKNLFDAPAPPRATTAQANAFKSQLEKAAFPLNKEAYNFFEAAYKRSQDIESFSKWTTLTYQKMVELAPDKHREVNELSANPSYLSYKVSINHSTSDLAD